MRAWDAFWRSVLALWRSPAAASLCRRPRVESASLNARLQVPSDWARATAISFGFQIGTPGRHRRRLTGISIRLSAKPRPWRPVASVWLRARGAVLEALGPTACPANSMMGSGNAPFRAPDRPDAGEGERRLTLVAGPSHDGYLHLLSPPAATYPVDWLSSSPRPCRFTAG